MPAKVKIGGVWKEFSGGRVRVGGAWKILDKGYVRVGGAWKQFYVREIATSTSISTGSVTYPTSVTVSGTVSPVPTGGTITILSSSTPIATNVAVNTSSGAYSTTIALDADTYGLRATYSGSGIYLSSTSGESIITVSRANTATTVDSDADFNLGTTVTLSANVKSGTTNIGGINVTFEAWNGSSWSSAGTDATNSSGNAAVSWTPTVATWTKIRARANISTNYNASTSAEPTIRIRQRTDTTYSLSVTQDDWDLKGNGLNNAEQVATLFRFPVGATGANGHTVKAIAIEVSGASGESANVAGALWTTAGSLVTSLEATIGSYTGGSAPAYNFNVPDAAVTAGQDYLVGFWRNDNSSSYTTQFSLDSSASGITTYYDNAAASVGTFTKNTTISNTSLIWSIAYYYWV
jgi:hypothetical protein